MKPQSALSILKTCGKEYGSDRLMKRIINRFIQECIKTLIPSQTLMDTEERWWGLTLDTEELLTADALLSSGRFQREQIIIPNPCKVESAKISARCPGLVIRQCTTHELFGDNCTALREIMGTDNAALRFIFLDYNGRRVPSRIFPLRLITLAPISLRAHTNQAIAMPSVAVRYQFRC
jgi:hypothetical protein